MWSLSYRIWRWSGYISMQNVRLFRQWVLQGITRKPKFDAFHNDKIVPKLEKSTDHDHNFMISAVGQDTSACRIPSHSLHEFSRKCPEIPNLTHFTKLKYHQNWNKANLRDLIAATGQVISNWIQIVNFSALVTVKFDGWPRKTIGHFFYTKSSFVHHFKSISEFKLDLQSRNTQFRSKLVICYPMWPWNLMDDLGKQ